MLTKFQFKRHLQLYVEKNFNITPPSYMRAHIESYT